MKTLLTISVLIFLVLLNSCKKEEESNTDKLCGKYWVVTEAIIDPSLPITDEFGNIIGYTSNIFAQMEPCDKDNVEKYNSDGTLVWDTRVKCDVNEVQSGTGTWIFNSDETKITETYGNESITYDIIELSNSKLKVNYEMDLLGVTYNLTITFVPE